MCSPDIIKICIYLDIVVIMVYIGFQKNERPHIHIFLITAHFYTAKFAGNWLLSVIWWEVKTPLHGGGSSCFSLDSLKLDQHLLLTQNFGLEQSCGIGGGLWSSPFLPVKVYSSSSAVPDPHLLSPCLFLGPFLALRVLTSNSYSRTHWLFWSWQKLIQSTTSQGHHSLRKGSF